MGGMSINSSFALRGSIVTGWEVIEDGVVVIDGEIQTFVGSAEAGRAAGYGDREPCVHEWVQ